MFRFRSIQWKLVLIYILLILLAMEVVGVYLIQSLEKYHIENLSQTIDSKAQLASSFVERYLYPTKQQQELDELIVELGKQAGPEVGNIMILDEIGLILSMANQTKFEKGMRLFTPEITQATFGNTAKEIREDPETKLRYMYLAYPVKNDDKVVGIIYIISSMEHIYDTLSDIKAILFVATTIALVITGVVGFALSKTITDPIQEVTKRAALMARGDFDHKIEVKSNDEIGKLTDMFNFLTMRLKDTLEEMSDEKEKVEAILTNMADGVIALNDNGQIIHINPAAKKMLSVGENFHAGKIEEKIKDLFSIDFNELFKKEVKSREMLVQIKKLTLKAIIAPLNRDDRIVGVIIVLQDITKQHRLENMRKEFVANVSHELRTPLTTIKSYTETLLDGALDDTNIAKTFLNVVDNEADRMTRLVSDLLELSRLDSKETRWNKTAVNSGQIVKEVVSKLHMSIKQKNQEIKVDIPEDTPDIFADKDKMEQVLQNILSNAIKYTPEEGKIYVKLEKSNNMVKITIEDTGVGIPKDDLPRIFERFYRVDKTRSREQGGTGLGLSIARELVEAHDGKIDIKSQLGKGTSVIVSIPAISQVEIPKCN